MKKANTILISDIHLGNPLSRVKYLLEILKEWKFKRLIILGDLVSIDNFERFHKHEWKFLHLISKYIKDGVEVVWVEGNHDIKIIDSISSLIGIEPCQEYEWFHGDKKCIAVHGHQYDSMIDGFFSDFWSWVYLCLLKFKWLKNHFGEEISTIQRDWQRIIPDVSKGCIELAKKMNKTFVFAGHTHFSERIEKDGIIYINTGSWVEKKSTLVVMTEDDVDILSFECFL